MWPQGGADEVYKGIVRGNTVILEEKLDLPDETRALVEIKPIDQTRAPCSLGLYNGS